MKMKMMVLFVVEEEMGFFWLVSRERISVWEGGKWWKENFLLFCDMLEWKNK